MNAGKKKKEEKEKKGWFSRSHAHKPEATTPDKEEGPKVTA